MQKIITKISAILLVVFGLVFVAGTVYGAQARWSEYPGEHGPISGLENGSQASVVQSDSSVGTQYHNVSYVQAGGFADVVVYFHNDGDAPAQNVNVKLTQPTGTNTSFTLTGTVTEAGGAVSSGSTTINIPSSQTLTYVTGSLRVSKDRGAGQPMGNGNEIFTTGINIGTIDGMNTCGGGDVLCHQGSVAVRFAVSQTTSSYQCNDGQDNDGDNLTDYPQDPGCSSPTDDSEFNQTTTYQCNDGIDNDNDGWTDYPSDPGCTSYTDNSEYNQQQQQCMITNFYASPTNVAYGGNTTLYWNTSNCTSLTVDGIAYPVNGSGNFGPLYAGRTYYVSATNGTSSDTDSVFVSVNQQQNQCRFTSFSASPTNVQSGGYTTLYWNTTDCTSLTIDGISYPVNGSGSFGPLYSSRTYYAYASGVNGSDNRSAYVSVNQQQNQCRFTYLQASPTNVQSGGYTTLTWNTTDCTSLSIDGITYPVNGSGTFGPLYSARTYYATAYGYNGSDTRNAYVTVNQTNTYQCNDGYDNDNDGRVDYPNDIGCTSQTDNDEFNTVVTVPNVITISATNIARTSAQLNGLATNVGNYQSTLYFEWGTTTALGNRTSSQTAFSSSEVSFFDTITGLTPNRVYYFRAVAQNSSGTYRGEIRSFITLTNPVVVNDPPIVVQPPVVVVNRGVNLGLGTNLVQLKFQDQFGANMPQNVCVGNLASWTLFYKNISGNTLNNVILHVDLPKDVAYRSSSGGIFNQADNSLTYSLGTLTIDQEGYITISGEVLSSAAATNLLVMTATLSFENPVNSARETAVAYGLMNAGVCQNGNNLAGLALFGAGFWPNTLVGWLILILILLALIWVIRALVVPAVVVHKHKRDDRTRNKFYEDMDVPTAPYRE